MAANLDLTQFRAEDGSNTKRRIQGVYTGPASYVTGGDPLLPAELKLGQLHVLDLTIIANATVILMTNYDHVNQKLKVYDMAGVEIANATDLSGYSGRFEAIGL